MMKATAALSPAEERVRAVLAQPDPRLLAEIRRRTWMGHNIPLSATESTISPDIPLMTNDERTSTIKALVRRFLDSSRPLRVADLGALEGGLSLEMAREGWEVTGFEGRPSNFEKAELIRTYFGLDNLHFALRDVKSLDRDRDGLFDVILCCGLLYHLDNPFAFLEKLLTVMSPEGILFLDTHVAPDAHAGRFGTHEAHLSPPATLEQGAHTYEGRWFTEPQGGSVFEQQWSAVSNERSFWPFRRELIRGVWHAGFHAVMELYGMWEIDREFGLRDQYSRLYLACRRQW